MTTLKKSDINEDVLKIIKDNQPIKKTNLFPEKAEETSHDFGLWYLSIRKTDRELATAYLGTTLVACITFNCKNFDEAITETKELFEKILISIKKMDKKTIDIK